MTTEQQAEKTRKLYWIATEQCNLGCRYCYYNTALKDRMKTKPIPIEEKLKVIEEAKEFFDEIIFTGGEALLDPDIYVLVQATKEQGLKVDVLTNGVLLTSENCQKLVDLKVDCVSISLDSLDVGINDAQRGKTAMVRQGIENLLAIKSPEMVMEIMMTVTRKNIYSIKDMVDFCFENNLNLWLDPVEINPDAKKVKRFDLTLMDEEEKRILAEAFEYWVEKSGESPLSLYSQACLQLIAGEKATGISCDMGTDHFVLNPDGGLTPCFSREDINYGNVFNDGLIAVMGNMLIDEKQPELQNAACVALGCVCMTMVTEHDPYSNNY